MDTKVLPNLSGVSETLLIPLYVRAAESQRPDALIHDPRAAGLVQQIDCDFARLKMQPQDEIAIILRLRQFDRLGREFLERHPAGLVVHIGCGLDTRFERLDNGQVVWCDLDLPPVIDLRRRLIGGESERYHLLAGSVLEDEWIQAVQALMPRPILFLAEGVLPYFENAQVKALFLKLCDRFPGAELACDATSALLTWADNLHLALAKMDARLRWGLKSPKEVESWRPGIKVLEEWYYCSESGPRLGAYRWMRFFPGLAKSAGIYHFRLGSPG